VHFCSEMMKYLTCPPLGSRTLGNDSAAAPTYWTINVMLIACCGPPALPEAVTETV